MALSKEEILDAIAEMSVMDIVSLIEAMEEKFGVTAAAAVAAAPAAAAGGDAGGAASGRVGFARERGSVERGRTSRRVDARSARSIATSRLTLSSSYAEYSLRGIGRARGRRASERATRAREARSAHGREEES